MTEIAMWCPKCQNARIVKTIMFSSPNAVGDIQATCSACGWVIYVGDQEKK